MNELKEKIHNINDEIEIFKIENKEYMDSNKNYENQFNDNIEVQKNIIKEITDIESLLHIFVKENKDINNKINQLEENKKITQLSIQNIKKVNVNDLNTLNKLKSL